MAGFTYPMEVPDSEKKKSVPSTRTKEQLDKEVGYIFMYVSAAAVGVFDLVNSISIFERPCKLLFYFGSIKPTFLVAVGRSY